MNWYRLAFIFLPAAIRGDIMYLSFFLPFLFGPILQRVVRGFVTLYDKTDNIKVQFLPSRKFRSPTQSISHAPSEYAKYSNLPQCEEHGHMNVCSRLVRFFLDRLAPLRVPCLSEMPAGD